MLRQIRLATAAALMLAFQTGALAQMASATSAAQDVQSLAPQLVTFAGSDANFQSLVNGLSQGVTVTITTITADGFLQTVTFTPAAAMSSAEIARTLEAARQQLIARGIANPTAEQIGVALAGGNLPTPSGAVQVGGLLPTLTPGGMRAGVLAGLPRPAAPIAGTANPVSNLAINVQPIASVPGSTSASSGSSTSASPAPSTSASPATSTSASPATTTSINSAPAFNPTVPGTSSASATPSSGPAPVINSSTGVNNGVPSPAAQMQGHR
jgi:hypothetical protein